MNERIYTPAIWRLPEIERRTGLKKSTLYRLMDQAGAKRFPPSIAIGGTSARGWDSRAVLNWIEQQTKAASSS
jgi:predicted DNA-binding transcriptional regulator AlpA